VRVNRRCSCFHNAGIGITQAASEHGQTRTVSPQTSETHRQKPLIGIAGDGMTQTLFKGAPLSRGHRRRPTVEWILGAGLRQGPLGLHQLHLSAIESGHSSGVRAAQQRFARASPDAPEHESQNEGSATSEELRHRGIELLCRRERRRRAL